MNESCPHAYWVTPLEGHPCNQGGQHVWCQTTIGGRVLYWQARQR